jgi:hypothetical protein
MPHVVVEGAGPLDQVYRKLEPFVERRGEVILKVVDLYLNQKGTSLLLESIVIEAGSQQSFFAQLSQKELSITVRLLPRTDPEKTPGVKRLLALIGGRVRALFPGSHFGKTNLEEFLKEIP